jgi:hypothetical protein
MRYSTTRPPGPIRRKPVVGVISARRGPPAKVRNAASALLQPILEAAHTARVRPPVAAMVETAPCPAIAPARQMPRAADTARVRPPVAAMAETAPHPAIAPARQMATAADTARARLPAAAMAETAPCPAIAPARHTEEAADTTPAVLIAAVARTVRAAAPTAVELVASKRWGQLPVWYKESNEDQSV